MAEIETVEQARERLHRNGARVVRATLHEDSGDRQVWFVGEGGWCYLAGDAKLIEFAQQSRPAPLDAQPGDDAGVAWPEGGTEV